MSANPKSRLTTAAEVATILGLIIAYLAFAYVIGWWPLNDVEAISTPTRVAMASETSATSVRPMSAPVATHVSPTSTLGIGSSKRSPIDGATMVYVPDGDFTMGSNDEDNEKPQHTVYLDAFWIDKFEVTNALYKKCVDAGRCSAPSDSKSSTRSTYYGNSQFDNYPVVYVRWDDATRYCTFAGEKLPTEAQWEKSARGTDGRIYPWGNTFDKNLLNSGDGGKDDTTAVGGYPSGASPFGLMDMAGNVWEWVADWYASYPSGTQRNPTGPTIGQDRVVRGGSWDTDTYNVHAADRGSSTVAYRNYNLGFRCVE